MCGRRRSWLSLTMLTENYTTKHWEGGQGNGTGQIVPKEREKKNIITQTDSCFFRFVSVVLNQSDLLTNNSVTNEKNTLATDHRLMAISFQGSYLFRLSFDCITQSCRWSGKKKRNLLQIINVEWTFLSLVNSSWLDFFVVPLLSRRYTHPNERMEKKITLFATPFKSPALLSSVSHSTLSTHAHEDGARSSARLGNSCCYTYSALLWHLSHLWWERAAASAAALKYLYLFIPFCLLAAEGNIFRRLISARALSA